MYFVIYPYKKPLQSAGVLFLMKGIFWLTPKKRGIHILPEGKVHRRGDFSRLENGFHKFAVGEFISL